MTGEAAILTDRSLLEIAGEERASFLQGLVTNDVEGLGTWRGVLRGAVVAAGENPLRLLCD